MILSAPLDRREPGFPSDRASLLQHFDDVFKEASATEDHELEAAFRLRYQVYCLDRGFEEATACPGGMEQDRYDGYAYHSLLRDRASNQAVGTVRLVRPGASAPSWVTKLPLAEYADIDSIDELRRLPGASTAEVSRFAITRSVREILRGATDAAEQQPNVAEKLMPYMSLGLIRGLVRASMRHGITHWCLAAEPSLLRRLRNYGLHFKDAGPLVEHRGLRQVCYADVRTLLARAEAERPEYWDVMTEGGTLLSGAGGRSQDAAACAA